MKTLPVLLIVLFAANASAATFECTTRFTNVKTSSTPTPKVCGAIRQDRLSDNGVKYERQPRLCTNFKVDFFSIRQGDAPRFTKYCATIFAKSCYMIGIHDHKGYQGLAGLDSYIVFPNIDAVPARFSVNARAVAHHHGVGVGVGRVVNLSLSCRKRP
jgi:hypothetical protein